MDDLATLDDVLPLCVRDLTGPEEDRVDALLTQASNWVRAYTRRDFTHDTTTQTLRAVGGTIVLPQTPVVAVTAVKLRDYLGNLFTVPAFGFDGIDRIDLSFYGIVLNLPETLSFNSTWAGTADVTYEHGFTDIPTDIIGVVAGAVARVFNLPTQDVGVQSQTAGPFSVTLEKGVSAGKPVFDADDRVILNRYRRGSIAAVELR